MRSSITWRKWRISLGMSQRISFERSLEISILARFSALYVYICIVKKFFIVHHFSQSIITIFFFLLYGGMNFFFFSELEMPKKPFGGKAKKAQLQAKRQRQAGKTNNETSTKICLLNTCTEYIIQGGLSPRVTLFPWVVYILIIDEIMQSLLYRMYLPK